MANSSASRLPRRECAQVSQEMISLIGRGRIDEAAWPPTPVAITFAMSAPATIRFYRAPLAGRLQDDPAELVLVVSDFAVRRVFGFLPEEDCSFHMPVNVRAIALSINENVVPELSRMTFQLAKSIELLCETFLSLGGHKLVPAGGETGLSRADSERILAARKMIDEHWGEKLTLESIARACGLNRAKLTRGFRDMFDCSVADALTQRRLDEARQLLRATDLPISSIGYRCGYLNNASFTRAFSRHFGVAPSVYRVCRLAA